jgi:hypothetical protein
LKVRLKGIAPPEAGQPFSDVAREHLKMLVLDKAVALDYTNLSEGYFEAKISINGIDLDRRCCVTAPPGTIPKYSRWQFSVVPVTSPHLIS